MVFTVASTNLSSLGYNGSQKSRTCIGKRKNDLENKEFAAGLSFVAVSRVHFLGDTLFRPFIFERLHHIKNCKRMQERKVEEEQLISMS